MTTLSSRAIAMHADLRLSTGLDAAETQHELPPLFGALRREISYWTTIYEAQARQDDRAAGRDGVPESQRTQTDDDGDVVMYAVRQSSASTTRTGPATGGLGSGANNSSGSQSQSGNSSNGPSPWEPPPALKALVPEPLLRWAHLPDPTTNSTLAALTLAATSSPAQSIREKELNEARILAARARHGLGSGDATEEADPEQLAKKVWQPPVQRNLTAALVDMQLDQLYKDLGRSGRPGKLVMAQLRSQRGPGAMSWTRVRSRAASTRRARSSCCSSRSWWTRSA